jgi:hypothetical protein
VPARNGDLERALRLQGGAASWLRARALGPSKETHMQYLGTLAISFLLLAAPNGTAGAQSGPDEAASREQLRQLAQGGRYGRDAEDDDDRGGWRRPSWRDGPRGGWHDRGDGPTEGRRRMMDEGHRDSAPRGGLGFGGMPGPMGRPGMMEMMMILMDSDGDGAVSLQEFQAAHERIFKAMDADKDGRLTLDEIRNFRLGAPRGPRP